jgi:hypothetical protein
MKIRLMFSLVCALIAVALGVITPLEAQVPGFKPALINSEEGYWVNGWPVFTIIYLGNRMEQTPKENVWVWVSLTGTGPIKDDLKGIPCNPTLPENRNDAMKVSTEVQAYREQQKIDRERILSECKSCF